MSYLVPPPWVSRTIATTMAATASAPTAASRATVGEAPSEPFGGGGGKLGRGVEGELWLSLEGKRQVKNECWFLVKRPRR